MDVIIDCAVLHEHRKLAFDVNTFGSYNMMELRPDLVDLRIFLGGDKSELLGLARTWAIAFEVTRNVEDGVRFFISERSPSRGRKVMANVYRLTLLVGAYTAQE